MSKAKAKLVKQAVEIRLAEGTVGTGSVFGGNTPDGFCIAGIGLAAVGVTANQYSYFDFKEIADDCELLSGVTIAKLFGCTNENLRAFTHEIGRVVSLNDGIIFGEYYAVTPKTDQHLAGKLLWKAVEKYATD